MVLGAPRDISEKFAGGEEIQFFGAQESRMPFAIARRVINRWRNECSRRSSGPTMTNCVYIAVHFIVAAFVRISPLLPASNDDNLLIISLFHQQLLPLRFRFTNLS